VIDVFAAEAVAFVNGFDNLQLDARKNFADLPDKASVRRVMAQAEWFRDQRGNVFLDFTLPQLVLIDLADAFLKWCSEPTNPARWDELFDFRYWLDTEGLS
jgi:hypothetical protein